MGSCCSHIQNKVREPQYDAWAYIEVPADVAISLYNIGVIHIPSNNLLHPNQVQYSRPRPMPAEMHITLLTNIESSANLSEQMAKIANEIRMNVKHCRIYNMYNLSEWKSEKRNVIHTRVYSDAIDDIAAYLRNSLSTNNNILYEYTPHITVAFCKPHAVLPALSSLALTIGRRFSRIVLQHGAS